MGIVGAAIYRVEALPIGQVDRDVGLADDDRAGRLQPPHQKRIARGGPAFELGVPPGGGQACNVEAFLDRHGHAEQRLIKPPRGLVHCLGDFAGAIEIGDGKSVEVGIQLTGPGDGRINCLRHADLAGADGERCGKCAGFVR